jgi:hypothetical protein
MRNLLDNHIKTINAIDNGWLINNKVIIDNNGILWNDFNNLKPFKNFPQYYFELSNKLVERLKP